MTDREYIVYLKRDIILLKWACFLMGVVGVVFLLKPFFAFISFLCGLFMFSCWLTILLNNYEINKLSERGVLRCRD